MIKIRIIGLVILIIGITIQFVLQNDVIDFISGIFTGGGIVLLITGRISKSQN